MVVHAGLATLLALERRQELGKLGLTRLPPIAQALAESSDW
jgi:hypothetical protein